MFKIILKSILLILIVIITLFYIIDYIETKKLSYSYCELANNSINLNNVFIEKYGIECGVVLPLKNPKCIK